MEQNHVYVEIAQSGRIANAEIHLSFFLSPTTILAHLLQLISGFVLNILWLVTDILNHFLLASRFLCWINALSQQVNKHWLCYLQREAI